MKLMEPPRPRLDNEEPSTVQRVVNPVEGLPYTEWLCEDGDTFTRDSRARHFVAARSVADRVALRLSTDSNFVFSVKVDIPERSAHRPAPLADGYRGEHLAGRPRRRADLDARDLRELEEREIYG